MKSLRYLIFSCVILSFISCTEELDELNCSSEATESKSRLCKTRSDEVITTPEPDKKIICQANTIQQSVCTDQKDNAKNAISLLTCNSDGTVLTQGSCVVDSCEEGYSLVDGECELDKVCEAQRVVDIKCEEQIENASEAYMQQICNTSGSEVTYGQCQLLACKQGYSKSGNTCIEDIVLTECPIGSLLSNGQCITPQGLKPFISQWKIDSANTKIKLPTYNSFTNPQYSFIVDWGDGSQGEVTSHDDVDTEHIYDLPGTYTVTISGIAQAWSVHPNNSDQLENLIAVIDLGNTDLHFLGNAFYKATNLVSFAGGDTSKVTNLRSMFEGCTSLTNINLSTFDTSNVITMGRMFYNNSSLSGLNLSNFDTSSVESFSSMFDGASNIENLNLAHFNTNSAYDTSYMFSRMRNLKNLNIENFNTTNVISMRYMFQGTGLESLDLSHFRTGKVQTMQGMLAQMQALTNLNISTFDTENVQDMRGMFVGTNKLISLDLSHFNTANVTDFRSVFSNMTALETLDLSNWDISKAVESRSIFYLNTAKVLCNQGGSPGTGQIFEKTCQ